jgi:hypothetical protein
VPIVNSELLENTGFMCSLQPLLLPLSVLYLVAAASTVFKSRAALHLRNRALRARTQRSESFGEGDRGWHTERITTDG